eukprot:SAG31_NODE_25749_length_455_cov_0.721910_1_plen_111_part_10
MFVSFGGGPNGGGQRVRILGGAGGRQGARVSVDQIEAAMMMALAGGARGGVRTLPPQLQLPQRDPQAWASFLRDAMDAQSSEAQPRPTAAAAVAAMESGTVAAENLGAFQD